MISMTRAYLNDVEAKRVEVLDTLVAYAVRAGCDPEKARRDTEETVAWLASRMSLPRV